MKTRLYCFITIIILSVFAIGCKTSISCKRFNEYYTLNASDISKKNHGYYYLCYIETEPRLIQLDSALGVSLPEQFIKYKTILKIVEINVKLIDLYFSEFSRQEAVNMWLNLRQGYIKEGEIFEDPHKTSFLKYKKMYFITCKNNAIKKVKNAYNRKKLLLVDQYCQNYDVEYFFAPNVFITDEVSFNGLFSFDDVLQEYLLKK